MEGTDGNSGKQRFLNFKSKKRAVITLAVIMISILFFFLLFKLQEVRHFLSSVTSFLAPVLYGIAIAYLLNPLVKRMRKPLTGFFTRRMKNQKKAVSLAKGFSITVAVIVAIVVIAVLLWLIIPQLFDSISKLIEAMPAQIDKVQKWYNGEVQSGTQWAQWMKDYLDKGLDALNKWLSTDLMNTINSTLSYLTSSVLGVISFVINMLIGIVVAVYALIEKDVFVGQAKKLTYTLFKPEKANFIIDTARHGDKIFGGFLSGKILDSLIVGIITFICLSLLKMPYTLLISVIIGVTNIIPFFGPFIGAIPCAFFILLIDPVQCFWFVVFIVILQQVDGNIIGPKILGTTTGISEFWVTFALLLFGGLFGFVGMIIGVPLFAVVYYVIKNAINRIISRKGLPTQSELYRDAGGVDPETLEFLPMPPPEVVSKKPAEKLRKRFKKKKK